MTAKLVDYSDSAQMPLAQSGHSFTRYYDRVRCATCGAVILDSTVYDEQQEGDLKDVVARLVLALGPCDQVARVKGRIAGSWQVTL